MKPTETHAENRQCLNCGTGLTDRFCSHCGQDSKEFRRSVWGIIVQFFETFTELDNTFLRSLIPLLIKPGFLTLKYLEGKRKRYLNPIQMYAFFSFLFFLMVFSFPDFTNGVEEESIGKQMERSLYKEDSLTKTKELKGNINGTNLTIGFPGLKIKLKDTVNGGPIELEHEVKTVKEYDSIQATLPDDRKNGFLTRIFYRRLLGVNSKVQQREQGVVEGMIDSFKSNIPNLMILLLPVFALIMRVAYFRRKWYYVEHLIFGIHIHCFAFLILALSIFLSGLTNYAEELDGLIPVIFILYFLIAIRNVYKQSWWKSVVKFIFIAISYCLAMVFGLVANLIFAAFLTGG